MLRRQFLSSGAISAVALGLPARHSEAGNADLSHFFNVQEFGAQPDGKTVNTASIQTCIDRAADLKGGIVYIPPGVFLTGGLVLRSYVTLYLEAGSVLLGSPRVADYPSQPGPSTDGNSVARHFIFARGCEGVSIVGTGTIDGNGSAFWTRRPDPESQWPWRHGSQPAKPEDLWRDVISMGWMSATPQRPSPMVELVSCKNLRIEGVTLANPAGWTLRPIACESVFITGIRVRNPVYSPNTDGMDITCCKNVFVSGCDIEAGDDAICIKSENPYGEVLPTKNIVITNCVLTTSSNGFKIGTNTFGAVENIVFSNSVIYNNNVPYNERVIAGLAIEVADGGTMDGVLVSGIRMQNVRTPIFVRLEHRHSGPKTALRNITIQGLDATGAIVTNSITGMPDVPVEAVSLDDVRIRTSEAGETGWASATVPEVEDQYPEARMFGRLPSYGIYVRHARGVRLRNVEMIAQKPDQRPAVLCDDVEDLIVSGLEATGPASSEPLIALKNTRRAFIHGSRAASGSALFLRASGSACSGIVLTGNDLGGATRPAACIDGAPEEAISLQR